MPETPDVLGLLRAQAAITVEGLDALREWANGDGPAADRVRALEHQADDAKGELRDALRRAFTTPLDPEDMFDLSQELDDVLNSAKNTVREAEVMRTEPDEAIAAMCNELADGTRHLADAIALLASRDRESAATEAADKAVKSQRYVEHIYRAAMSALIDVADMREVTAKRELYRRLVRTSDHLAGVAERVWYSVLKEG
jgi:uncharacterized protein Yka (UPF0111/DUF47 family)